MRRKRLKQYRRNARTICMLALSFAIIAGCSDTIPISSTNTPAGQEQALKSVKVIKVAKQKIGDPVEHAGDVQSSIQFDVVAKAAGDIESILKARGDLVQEGEVIVRLNSSEAKFQRDKANLAVETAQSAISKAKERARKDLENQKRELALSIDKLEQSLVDLTKSYNKAKNDYEVGLATKAQVYQAEVQLRSTRFDLEQMKQKKNTLVVDDSAADLETQLKNAQISLLQLEQSMSYLEVKAPVSGILTELPLEVGMTLQTGAKLGVIQKVDPIRIKAFLNTDEAKFVSNKTELSYYITGTSQKAKGKVSFLSKVIDPETKAYELNLEIPNKDMALKPGMKAVMQLTDEQEQIVVAVPTYSMVKEGDDSYVFVLNGDVVEKRKIQPGRLNDSIQEVVSGLKEGELIVTNPGPLKDKEKVQHSAAEEQK
ncbi:efflux RND transporter periplasmic adaptor subunit [Paenibacillus rigui]|uniref:Efflux transporter periplasmic adaptor subunit n=1 Tax=Paenibacillus rigui TaxID=554312 RepID=A0A229UP67_9BACL|nr:efflux RND transporter periplasmic adaptor subunit [Paenibacillus rigui]OXM85202.1 efflux transporter periplasmic adaptor subunit [Paenibacillus rigui]